MRKAHKKKGGKPAREDVVKTFDNMPATDSQPAPPLRGDLPPSHTKAEIAAVAAHLLPHLPPEESVAPFAIQKAVELLDAAEQASKQRDIERAWLQAEGTPWAQMSFEDGVKLIVGDAKHPGRAKDTYRVFREWRLWIQGKHNAGAADEMWRLHQATTTWAPQRLAEAKALFDDWKKRGRPEARERRGRPGAFDLRGNIPHPPTTTGRAKEKGGEPAPPKES